MSPSNVEPGEERIRRKILIPLTVTLGIFIALFIFFARGYLHREMARALHRQSQTVEILYNEFIEQRTALLNSLAGQILRNKELQQAMQAGDRQGLLNITRSLISPVGGKKFLSHLYFLTPAGEVFLREHLPERHGDVITRRTFVKARETGRTAAGVEMGPLGTFTLRVVSPWVVNGERIGYVEVGEDVNYLIRKLADIVQFRYLITIRKPFLHQSDWESGLRAFGREGDWNRYPHRVVLDDTLPEIPPELERILASRTIGRDQEILIRSGGRAFHGDFIPLMDGNRQVGDLLVLSDVTETLRKFRWTMASVIAFCLLLGGGMILTTTLGLGGLDRKLALARRQLKEEIRRTRSINEHLEEENFERRQAEAALEEARDHLELRVAERTAEIIGILRSVEDILFAIDSKGRVLLLNSSAESFLGRTLRECQGRPVEEVITNPVLLEQIRSALRQRQGTGQFDFRLPGSDGRRECIMQARISIIGEQEEDFGGIVFLIQDVTEEREMDRLKSEFISTAAHELRTPMATILGYSELMLNFESFSPEEQREFLTLIYQKADGISSLLDDLLDLSRMESGQMLELHTAPVSAQELFAPAVTHYEKFSRRHRFELTLCDPETKIAVDPGKIGQVMENLLSNAVKYSPDGGTVKVAGSCGSGLYQVSVKDEGVGMTPEQVRRAFQKFYRADSSDTAAHGTGLGLTIVKNIIDAHGGRIWVESRFGEGTIIHFALPLSESPQAEAASATPS